MININSYTYLPILFFPKSFWTPLEHVRTLNCPKRMRLQFEKNWFFDSFKRFILNADDVPRCPILVLSRDSLIPFRNVVVRSERRWQGVTGSFDPDDLHPTYPGAGDIYSRTRRRDTRWLESPLELREQRNYWKLCDRLIVRLRIHLSEPTLKSSRRPNKDARAARLVPDLLKRQRAPHPK